MLQVPDVHVTFEPAPAVCVHEAPAQLTLQFAPQVPVQVAPEAHAKLHPLVVALQASNAHVCAEAQLQSVPEHTVPHPDSPRPSTDSTNTTTARSFTGRPLERGKVALGESRPVRARTPGRGFSSQVDAVALRIATSPTWPQRCLVPAPGPSSGRGRVAH
jgi:hypothetical protein